VLSEIWNDYRREKQKIFSEKFTKSTLCGLFFEKLTNTMDSGKRRKIPVLTVDAVEWGI
jgi:hypothetical protein